MPAGKSPLVFFVTDDQCPERTTATATLAWLAAEAGREFDGYMEAGPRQRGGSPISTPFTGNWHGEQFYFLAHFFDITFCSLSTAPQVQYRREASAIGARMLPAYAADRIGDFYLDAFRELGRPLPSEAVVIPAGTAEATAELEVDPFCYPDIYYRRALGLSTAVSEEELGKLQEAGLHTAWLLYCDQVVQERFEGLGFQVEIIDSLCPDDTYGAVTCRIADRWIDRAKGIAFGNQGLILKMLPFNMRHDKLALYEPHDWREFAKTVGEYAERVGDHLVWGNQTVLPRSTDDVITEFSRYDCAMSLGVNIAGPTIQEKIKLPADWLAEAKAPWQEEYADDFLEEKAREGAIPVCYLMYAADLGHMSTYPRLFDLMSAWYGRCGLAFPSTWYDFNAEALQQLYIPARLGGVFPRVEPLLSSTGLGVGTEAKGFMTKKTLLAMLGEAMDSIGRHVGPDKVPIGYLPWQDACPYYQHGTGEPQFDVPQELGFEYCVTYKDEGQAPHVVYQDGRFMAINKQNVHWGQEGGILNHTKLWEEKLARAGKASWILIDLDAPFWFQIPHYFDPVLPTHYDFEASMVEIATCLRYVDGGGESGKLFIARPHEVVRYARILQRLGLL